MKTTNNPGGNAMNDHNRQIGIRILVTDDGTEAAIADQYAETFSCHRCDHFPTFGWFAGKPTCGTCINVLTAQALDDATDAENLVSMVRWSEDRTRRCPRCQSILAKTLDDNSGTFRFRCEPCDVEECPHCGEWTTYNDEIEWHHIDPLAACWLHPAVSELSAGRLIAAPNNRRNDR